MQEPMPQMSLDEWEAQVRPLIDTYVVPFYLKMMGLKAIESGERLAAAIVATAADASDDVILTLLHAYWRERVTGAWLSLVKSDERINAAVLQALATSRGSLDAPPLAAAADSK